MTQPWPFLKLLDKISLVLATLGPDLIYTCAHRPEPLFATNDICGKTNSQLLPEPTASQLQSWQIRARDKKESVQELLVIKTPTRTRFFEVTIEPADDDGLSMIAFDITASKEAEGAAISANEAKSEFLAHLSHEIRTPIGIILGFADLASDLLEGQPRAQCFLQAIRRNGQHLHSLVGEVLDLSKLDAGRIELDLRSCHVPQLLQEVAEGFRAATQVKKIELQMDLQNVRSTWFRTDPLRLQQIINNVLSNAVKFTTEGRIQVNVSETWGDSGSRLRFEVQDTGIGIGVDQIARLFRPFSQADGSFARRFGGTGLGLLLSKRLASKLGGDLWLEQTHEGQGSLFIFEITADRCGGPETPVEKPPEARPEEHRRKLLLVEDSDDNQLIVQAYLRPLDLQVDVAQQGEEGLRMASETAYDLILMDLQMPLMDGYEAVRQMRQRGLRTPVVALTAHALNTERDRAMAAGCDDFMTKPIHRPTLLQKVERHLRRAQVEKNPPAGKPS